MDFYNAMAKQDMQLPTWHQNTAMFTAYKDYTCGRIKRGFIINADNDVSVILSKELAAKYFWIHTY